MRTGAALRSHRIRCRDSATTKGIVIAFLLFAIVAVIFWPVALVIALGWFALLILRICFGITVLGIKATAATGIAAKMLHDSMRGSWPYPGKD
jgi:fucose permease